MLLGKTDRSWSIFLRFPSSEDLGPSGPNCLTVLQSAPQMLVLLCLAFLAIFWIEIVRTKPSKVYSYYFLTGTLWVMRFEQFHKYMPKNTTFFFFLFSLSHQGSPLVLIEIGNVALPQPHQRCISHLTWTIRSNNLHYNLHLGIHPPSTWGCNNRAWDTKLSRSPFALAILILYWLQMLRGGWAQTSRMEETHWILYISLLGLSYQNTIQKVA